MADIVASEVFCFQGSMQLLGAGAGLLDQTSGIPGRATGFLGAAAAPTPTPTQVPADAGQPHPRCELAGHPLPPSRGPGPSAHLGPLGTLRDSPHLSRRDPAAAVGTRHALPEPQQNGLAAPAPRPSAPARCLPPRPERARERGPRLPSPSRAHPHLSLRRARPSARRATRESGPSVKPTRRDMEQKKKPNPSHHFIRISGAEARTPPPLRLQPGHLQSNSA
uniref:serine/arginine repetitive matrix protein 1-like n=1 Tax=Jaculus jaculus TaxID=51337 RepID=UPI001E1B36B2|nr:serine/arginine repetitive matrix protein 1-like [Jaculus jaculus]